MFEVKWSYFNQPEKEKSTQDDFEVQCFSPSKTIKNVRSFSQTNKELLGEKKQANRSSSRACCLMVNTCSQIPEDIINNTLKKEKTGIYCAVENGSVDYESVKELAVETPQSFPTAYKRARNPKMYLKQLPNLAAAQVGIFLGINGPTYIFTHSIFGGKHAMEQAIFDLENGNVDTAIIISAFSNEDKLNLLKYDQRENKELSEGSIAAIIQKSDKSSSTKSDSQTRQYNYGILNELIDELNLKEKEI